MSEQRGWRMGIGAGLLLALSACGGGGSPSENAGDTAGSGSGSGTGTGTGSGSGTGTGGTPVVAAKLGAADAARLLQQATFGPTQEEIDRISTLTASQWLDEQFAAPASSHLAECRRLKNGTGVVDHDSRQDAWWNLALTGPDQLRQRVAFALSEIMVVSENSDSLSGEQEGLCWFYDVLVNDAFGSYRTLLKDVTLSPQMGVYLSMLNNAKPASGRRADENYARESMQLMSVGLAVLNANGTPQLDSSGQPVASYTQADIEGLARVYTGWSFAGQASWGSGPANWLAPMTAYEARHDTDAKTLINNTAIPAGGNAMTDLDKAMDALSQHASTGPFIARQLIQKLVTSNPSPAYVKRVADVFANDGSGARGNLKAVLRAIFTDDEARRGVAANAQFGKFREPMLRVANYWRAMHALPSANTGSYSYRWTGSYDLNQMSLAAPSVFNFYSPSYAPPGELRDAKLLAPELQMANETAVARVDNRMSANIYDEWQGSTASWVSAYAMRTNLAPLIAKSGDIDALLAVIDGLFMPGQMTPAYKASLKEYLATIAITSDGGRQRVQEALYLSLTSPQYLFQR